MARFRLATIARSMLDLACGGRCPGCGRSHAAARPCRDCLQELAHTPRPAGAGWLDTGIAARLARAGKHGTWRGAGPVLAQLLTARLDLPQVDAVTWVPADPRRRARRGGCLPESVARSLARELGVPALQLLARTGGSRSQRGRSRRERIANVADAYEPRRAASLVQPGTTVLLVDDVRTTGATLDAAARQLRRLALEVVPISLVAVDRSMHPAGVWIDFADSPQRARNFRSRSGSHLPISWVTSEERQSQDLNAPRPP